MSFDPPRLRGPYPITSATLCRDDARLQAGVAAALAGGAELIQYRDKAASPEQRLRRVRQLVELCRRQGARLIVNDDIELAERGGADGVHLGASDPPLGEARRRLGAGAIIGASCGPSVARARIAADGGADYVALGRFFPSRSKPEAPQAGIESLIEARQQVRVPICVIGGITPSNAPPLVEAGADLVAAIEGIFEFFDGAAIESATRRYAALFHHATR